MRVLVSAIALRLPHRTKFRVFTGKAYRVCAHGVSACRRRCIAYTSWISLSGRRWQGWHRGNIATKPVSSSIQSTECPGRAAWHRTQGLRCQRSTSRSSNATVASTRHGEVGLDMRRSQTPRPRHTQRLRHLPWTGGNTRPWESWGAKGRGPPIPCQPVTSPRCKERGGWCPWSRTCHPCPPCRLTSIVLPSLGYGQERWHVPEGADKGLIESGFPSQPLSLHLHTPLQAPKTLHIPGETVRKLLPTSRGKTRSL
jgi:hypothetical protein